MSARYRKIVNQNRTKIELDKIQNSRKDFKTKIC